MHNWATITIPNFRNSLTNPLNSVPFVVTTAFKFPLPTPGNHCCMFCPLDSPIPRHYMALESCTT